jgi:hypothetical protein
MSKECINFFGPIYISEKLQLTGSRQAEVTESTNPIRYLIVTPPSRGDVLALNLHKLCSSAAFPKIFGPETLLDWSTFTEYVCFVVPHLLNRSQFHEIS